MKRLSKSKIQKLIREEFLNLLKEDLGDQIAKNLEKMKAKKKKEKEDKEKALAAKAIADYEAKKKREAEEAERKRREQKRNKHVGWKRPGPTGPIKRGTAEWNWFMNESNQMHRDWGARTEDQKKSRSWTRKFLKEYKLLLKMSERVEKGGSWVARMQKNYDTVYRPHYRKLLAKIGSSSTRKRVRTCGQAGSGYGQQDFKPKDPKLKKGPDPEYDKFYADLDEYKLTRYLGRRGKDYLWGPAHRRAYRKLVCAAEDAGKNLTTSPTDQPDERGQSDAAKETPAPPQPAVNIPEWAKKLGSKNIASPAGPECPPQWSPSRPARAVFLEKNEKEQWALYAKYPNQRPEWFPKWLESTKAKMEKREKTLRDFAIRYLQVKTGNKLTLSDIKLTAMIRSTGTLQPDGMVKMKEVLVKMLDCEIKWFNMPEEEKKKALDAAKITKPAPKPTPTPQPKPKPKPTPEPKPIPDDKPEENPIYDPPLPPPEDEDKAVTFEEAIMKTQYGDTMRVTFLKDVTVSKLGMTATPFKAGKTYSGAVYGNIKINHEPVPLVGSKSQMSKKEFIARVKAQGGEPCDIVDCNKSTITRSGKRVTFSDFLKNPNVLN